MRPLTLLFLLVTTFAAAARAGGPVQTDFPELPPGFLMEEFGGEPFDVPMSLAFLPWGDMGGGHGLRHDEEEESMPFLLAEKRGVLWSVDKHEERRVLLDLQGESLNEENRGLLAVVLDPEFADTGFIYLFVVVDPLGSDEPTATFSRVVRYTTESDDDGAVTVVPGSRRILIGETFADGILNCTGTHAGGDLQFLPDGSLVVSTGDGAHHLDVDPGGQDPECFGPGRFPPREDVGAFRALDVRSYSGKLLRIDPFSGHGLPDNPFYSGDGTLVRDKVWCVGLRNPFKLALVPDHILPGAVMVADVGWDLWEEVNVAVGGENFAWPCFEGPRPNLPYRNQDPGNFCSRTAGTETQAFLGYHHFDAGEAGFAGTCIGGMAVYEGHDYPDLYHEQLFVADFSSDRLRVLILEEHSLEIANILDFGAFLGSPYDLLTHPGNGDIVFLSQRYGLRRLRYLGQNLPPAVVLSATPQWGDTPLSVTLDASESVDPEGGALAFEWDLDDGTTSTEPVLTHLFVDPRGYRVTLTVEDPEGLRTTEEVVISPGNTPPRVELLTPAEGGRFTDGEPLTLRGTVTDAEDDAGGTPITGRFVIDLVHDHHIHPNWFVAEGEEVEYVPSFHGNGTFLRIRYEATDSQGLRDEAIADVFTTVEPRPHLADVSDTDVRLGVPVTVTGHVEYPGAGPAEITLEWGDGTPPVDLGSALHQEDRRAEHVYGAPGEYEITLTGRADGSELSVSQTIQVRRPAPAVAVFASLATERVLRFGEQQSIAARLTETLNELDVEAETFFFAEQDQLADWMEIYLDDGVADCLVVLDAIPSSVFAFERDGSLGEAWLENGNGIVWTGTKPFKVHVALDGTSTDAAGPEENDILDATGAGLCRGRGIQKPGEDLRSFRLGKPWETTTSLLFGGLGPDWELERRFSVSENERHSDALLLRHRSGGFYAQFYTGADTANPLPHPRAEVIGEFLLRHIVNPKPHEQVERPAGPGPKR